MVHIIRTDILDVPLQIQINFISIHTMRGLSHVFADTLTIKTGTSKH
jgi:hypothetical protein